MYGLPFVDIFQARENQRLRFDALLFIDASRAREAFRLPSI
jgi:hypothetical protein